LIWVLCALLEALSASIWRYWGALGRSWGVQKRVHVSKNPREPQRLPKDCLQILCQILGKVISSKNAFMSRKKYSCFEKPMETAKALPLTSKNAFMSRKTQGKHKGSLRKTQGSHEDFALKACLSIVLVVPFWRALLFHPCRHFFQNEGISIGFPKPPSRYFFLVLLSCSFIFVYLYTKVL
jgi:hypothetical protein